MQLNCEIHPDVEVLNAYNKLYKEMEGEYLDCGTMHGYIKSNLEISKL